MDQGWSALIAGLAGLVGAAVGGYFAKAGAVQGAKTAADAVARQVEEQRAHELTQWIRQERRAAFGEVVRAHGELAGRLAALRVAVERGSVVGATGEQVDEAWTLLSLACSGVHLFGPEPVWIAADRVRSTAHECVIAHRPLMTPASDADEGQRVLARHDLARPREEMRSAMSDFSARSREALEVPS
ncbi:hypothetical protein ACFVGN_32750 [Streptomyces sp. NPDC057757]|uniref:hypothetical protein n=1 Tax=Streptomyces sp. NPDC057757 TaxID=3346241 RepID=UPI0036A135A7